MQKDRILKTDEAVSDSQAASAHELFMTIARAFAVY